MRFLTALFFTLAAGVAAAQEDTARFDLGEDAFRAGQAVRLTEADRDDVFMAGERVTLAADAGSAYLAGRWVDLQAGLGGDLFAAGQTVDVAAPVGGDATLFAQEVRLGAPVEGDLRAFGSEVGIGAPVGGTMLVAGEFVTWNAAVEGDVALTARQVDFGPDARAGGTLILYEDDPGTLEVPARVAPAERIERRDMGDWDTDYGGWKEYSPVTPGGMIGGFLAGVLFVAAVAALAAAIVPQRMAALRRAVLEHPGRSLLWGFLVLSVLVGGGFVLALTLIGLLFLPAMLLLAGLTWFAGYVVGAYALGVGLLKATGRPDPDSTGIRALAAALGALVAGLVVLIPVLGWILLLLLTWAGAGALVLRILRPRFFADTPA